MEIKDWDSLPLSEKRNYISYAVDQGISDLRSIKDAYKELYQHRFDYGGEESDTSDINIPPEEDLDMEALKPQLNQEDIERVVTNSIHKGKKK